MRTTTSPVGLAVLAVLASSACTEPDAAAPEPMPDEGRAAIEEVRGRMFGVAMEAEPTLDNELVTRAEPDACFSGIGEDAGEPPCDADARPKIDQTDLVGGAAAEGFAYFGTASNLACLMADLFVEGLEPFATDDLVCELEAGPGPVLGDHRPPRILRLDLETDEIEDITPDDERIATTVALFGAVAHRDVVMLSGPNVGADGRIDGVNVFAFEGSTGEPIGATTLAEHVGLTESVVVDGVLYVGAKNADGSGSILRWTGDRFEPFSFESVGELESWPSALVEHQGHIVVAGHAGLTEEGGPGAMAALYLSPVVPDRGLREADQDGWQRIFQMDDYEPAPIVARTTRFGDLASYRGRLFFTTSQSPFASTLAVFDAYGRPETWWGRLMAHAHASRSVSLLVMDDVGTDRRRVTLLYGNDEVPVFDPATGDLDAVPNALGQEPVFGEAGIGSPLNHMANLTVFEDRLYLSTFDDGTIGPELLEPMAAQEALLDLPPEVVDVLQPIAELAAEQAGADLYRMDAPYRELVAEDLSGLGNPSNHGVGVLLPIQDRLYIGTSNPFNLRTGEEDPGGYELRALSEGADQPAPPEPDDDQPAPPEPDDDQTPSPESEDDRAPSPETGAEGDETP